MRSWRDIVADAKPGRAFSNHTHWEVWADGPRGCYSCVKDGMGVGEEQPQCPIYGVAVCEGVTPAEWTEHGLGDYTCAEYEERPDDDGGPDDVPAPDPDPGPPAVIEGQLDIFDVYATQIIESSTSETLEAVK